VLAWDQFFIERAQVALIAPYTKRPGAFIRAARVLLRNRRQTDEFGFADGVEYDRARSEFNRRLWGPPQYYSTSYGRRPPYSYVVARYLFENYPEKTLVVSSPYEIAQLNRLRIPRERPRDR
jgi:hypothetical protein